MSYNNSSWSIIVYFHNRNDICSYSRTRPRPNWMSPLLRSQINICILFLVLYASIAIGKAATARLRRARFMFKVKAHALGIRREWRETKTEQYYCIRDAARVQLKQKRWRRANTLEDEWKSSMMTFLFLITIREQRWRDHRTDHFLDDLRRSVMLDVMSTASHRDDADQRVDLRRGESFERKKTSTNQTNREMISVNMTSERTNERTSLLLIQVFVALE